MMVEILLTVKAYSPYDPIDKDYRAKHPVPITARGTVCKDYVPGIAGYLPLFPRGSTITVPGYNNNAPAPVDDTGGFIRKAKGTLIEIRVPTPSDAIKWGTKTIKVLVYYPDNQRQPNE